jgi:hypothetical protein
MFCKSSRLGPCFLFIFFFLLALPIKAGLFKHYELSELKKCLKKVKKEYREDLDLSCPLPEFVAKAREKNYKEPGKRFLVARVLVQALKTRHQSELLFGDSSESEENQAIAEMFPELPASRSQYLQYFFPESGQNRVPVLPPSKEAKFLSQSKNLVDEILFWLEPLREEKSSKKLRLFLKDETSHILFWAYGLSLRFDSLYQLIDSDEKALLHNRDFEQLYLTQVSQWIKQFGALPLRSWYSKKIKSKLAPMGGPLSDTAWNYWIESIRLLERPVNPEDKDLLAQLRWLWVISPEAKRNLELKNLIDELGLGKTRDSWSLSQLTWQEYLWRVQALSSSLSTRAADQMMEALLKESSKLLSNRDEVWEALQVHIKIMKILDERHRISKLIQKYNEKFKFFTTPEDKNEIPKHFERLYQIAVQFWTLEENKQALDILNKIEGSKERAHASVLSKVAYVKARMNEEKDLEGLKKAFKMDLRDDQKLELGWRVFFKLYEGSLKQVTESLNFIERYASTFKNLEEAPLKIAFWKAQSLVKLKKDKEAVKVFTKNFEEDPYSFYGLMSAYMLRELTGKFPDKWEIKNLKSTSAFNEADYLDGEGYPTSDAYTQVATAIVLGKVYEDDRGIAVLKELSNGKSGNGFLSSGEKFDKARDLARIFVELNDKRSGMNLMAGYLSKNSEDFSSEDWGFIFPRVYEEDIRKQSSKVGIDPWVVSSIIRQESAFNPRARSSVDALGLMQLLPVTAQKEAKILGKDSFQTEDLFDPDTAIEFGTSNISRLLKIFDKSYICSFAAYNAGIPPVKLWMKQYGTAYPFTFIERITYKETRDYVKKLLRNFVMYRRLYEKEMPVLTSLLTMPSDEVSANIPDHEDSDRVAKK